MSRQENGSEPTFKQLKAAADQAVEMGLVSLPRPKGISSPERDLPTDRDREFSEKGSWLLGFLSNPIFKLSTAVGIGGTAAVFGAQVVDEIAKTAPASVGRPIDRSIDDNKVLADHLPPGSLPGLPPPSLPPHGPGSSPVPRGGSGVYPIFVRVEKTVVGVPDADPSSAKIAKVTVFLDNKIADRKLTQGEPRDFLTTGSDGVAEIEVPFSTYLDPIKTKVEVCAEETEIAEGTRSIIGKVCQEVGRDYKVILRLLNELISPTPTPSPTRTPEATPRSTASPTPPERPREGQIKVEKIHDRSGNGRRDAGEEGLIWGFNVDGPGNNDFRLTTQGDGTVIVTVPEGSYTICEDQQPGWFETLRQVCKTAFVKAASIAPFPFFNKQEVPTPPPVTPPPTPEATPRPTPKVEKTPTPATPRPTTEATPQPPAPRTPEPRKPIPAIPVATPRPERTPGPAPTATPEPIVCPDGKPLPEAFQQALANRDAQKLAEMLVEIKCQSIKEYNDLLAKILASDEKLAKALEALGIDVNGDGRTGIDTDGDGTPDVPSIPDQIGVEPGGKSIAQRLSDLLTNFETRLNNLQGYLEGHFNQIDRDHRELKGDSTPWMLIGLISGFGGATLTAIGGHHLWSRRRARRQEGLIRGLYPQPPITPETEEVLQRPQEAQVTNRVRITEPGRGGMPSTIREWVVREVRLDETDPQRSRRFYFLERIDNPQVTQPFTDNDFVRLRQQNQLEVVDQGLGNQVAGVGQMIGERRVIGVSRVNGGRQYRLRNAQGQSETLTEEQVSGLIEQETQRRQEEEQRRQTEAQRTMEIDGLRVTPEEFNEVVGVVAAALRGVPGQEQEALISDRLRGVLARGGVANALDPQAVAAARAVEETINRLARGTVVTRAQITNNQIAQEQRRQQEQQELDRLQDIQPTEQEIQTIAGLMLSLLKVAIPQLTNEQVQVIAGQLGPNIIGQVRDVLTRWGIPAQRLQADVQVIREWDQAMHNLPEPIRAQIAARAEQLVEEQRRGQRPPTPRRERTQEGGRGRGAEGGQASRTVEERRQLQDRRGTGAPTPAPEPAAPSAEAPASIQLRIGGNERVVVRVNREFTGADENTYRVIGYSADGQSFTLRNTRTRRQATFNKLRMVTLVREDRERARQ